MTLNEKQLKELAEFLDLKVIHINGSDQFILRKDYFICVDTDLELLSNLPFYLFKMPYAPILLHLAMVELEKRGFDWCVSCTEENEYQ